ncbi:MAG: hypothetical protein EBX39_00605, partial [Actinobacteria bacterium]|nr:hypothetical protein [Actinomycetota bacterium]
LAEDGETVDVIMLLGADPLSDVPDAQLAERGLSGARTIISVDTLLNASSMRADIVLAAAGFAEKTGSTTNLEGRVSALSQRVTAPGTARADWVLAAELASRLGADLGFTTSAEILAEIGSVAPSHLGLTPDLLAVAADGLVVPADLPEPIEEIDTEVVDVEAASEVTDAQGDADGSGDADATAAVDEVVLAELELAEAAASQPAPVSFTPTAAVPAPPLDAYSFRLIATRKLYDQGTIVQAGNHLAGLAAGTSVRVNPYDFDRLGVAPGGTVSVSSPRATLMMPILADAGVARGTAAVVLNQADHQVTELMNIDDVVTELRIETVK